MGYDYNWRELLSHGSSELEIKTDHFIIRGDPAEAAVALANDILKKKLEKQKDENLSNLFKDLSWTYCGFITVVIKDDLVTLGLNHIYPLEKRWVRLKKDVEKICNELKAFV